jgi:hypothetical protein
MDLKLTDSHDVLIENFDLVLIDGKEAVRQQILVKLKLWRGEWFLDTEFGTPWLQDVLGKQLSLSGVLAALQTSILEVAGTTRFQSFEYDFSRQERRLIVNFIVETIYGPIEVSA